MTYWGVLQGGGRMLLGDPREAVLSFDWDAPANQLKAVFPADRIWEDINEVCMYEGGKGVFRGIVDEQNTRLTSEGLFVELVSRSREALLLDNEAEPVIIKRPSLESIHKRLIEPLGFGRIKGESGSVPGEMRVEKGASCWQVLCDFCGEYLGTEPYVDFEGDIRCEGLGEVRAELRDVISAELQRLPYKRLSAVWKQGYRGGYDTLYSDPEAPIVRRRYVSAQSGRDPRGMLEKAKRDSGLLTVVCAGGVWPLRGMIADVSVPGLGRFEGCRVRRGAYLRDGNGERTRLVLERGNGNVADQEAFQRRRSEAAQRQGRGGRGLLSAGGEPV